MPTLIELNKVVIKPHYTQREINDIKTKQALDFVMGWFKKRVAPKGGIPLIKPAGPQDRILILQSGTGSGKSTSLPPALLTLFGTDRNIAITQPRVLTAMDIPLEIASIFDNITFGENIGYQTGNYVYKPKKGIVFMTIGVLAQQLKVMSDVEIMNKYAFIIIDECHDRSEGMDIALSLMKKFIHRNSTNLQCPFLILTSATFDTVKYSEYFGIDPKRTIHVEGRSYPIEEHFLESTASDFIAAAVGKAIELHNTKPTGNADILIFVHGVGPMRKIVETLAENNTGYVIIELTGTTFKSGSADYQNIFKPLDTQRVEIDGKTVIPTRRIIVATNVAETGVTIETLRYVIDTGFENSVVFNPIFGSQSIIPRAVTRASALQRKGRAGRKMPGEWYPIFTKETFDQMRKDKFPEIITSDPTRTVLGLLVKTVIPSWDGVVEKQIPEHKFDITDMGLMDDLPADSVAYSLERLFVLGLVDSQLNPTLFGLAAMHMSKLRVETSRMLLAGYTYGANIPDLITIAAFMHVGERNYLTESTYEVKDEFIRALYIWRDFVDATKTMSFSKMREMCTKKGIIFSGMTLIVSVRDEIIESMVQGIGLDPYSNGCEMKNYDLFEIMKVDPQMAQVEIQKIKSCIYDGFRLNVATRVNDMYILDSCQEKIIIESDKPHVVVHDIMLKETRSGRFMLHGVGVTEIDPDAWLANS